MLLETGFVLHIFRYMKKINFLVFIFFTVWFLGCNDDEEVIVQAPSINIISPNDGEVIAPGETIFLRARVEDEVGLEEVVISITSPGGVENSFTRDSSDFIEDGRVDEVERDFMIPESASPGTYTISIDAENTAGKKAPQAIVTIQVEEG